MSKRAASTRAGSVVVKKFVVSAKPPPKSVHIEDDIFAVVSEYEGMRNVHVRRYKKSGFVFFPTKEGVTFSTEQWDMFFNERKVMKEAVLSREFGKVIFQEGKIVVTVTHSDDAEQHLYVEFVKGNIGEILLTAEMFVTLVDEVMGKVNNFL